MINLKPVHEHWLKVILAFFAAGFSIGFSISTWVM